MGEDSDVPNVGGIRTDVVEALRALAIPNLRWPGGCFADEYHWRDGIGPRDQRPRMVNSHWGDVVEDNSFGTHEFLHLCELLGADPYVNGNFGSGTVREMKEWVEYLTRADDSPMASLRRANGRDEPWEVPFFGIGNEAWGCGGNMRAEAYADLARQYATYVRNHGENQVYRIAAGANSDDYSWTEALMKALGCLGCNREVAGPFQAVSLHYYTMTGPWQDKGAATVFTDDEYDRTIAAAHHVEELLTRHSTVMDRFDPYKKVGLVLDEWGTWWNAEPGTNPGFLYQQNTMRDALVASLHFDVFHRLADRLSMANIAQTVNVLQAMLLTDEETGALVRTPTYHVFEMNKVHHDATSVPVHVRAPQAQRRVAGRTVPTLSASASVDAGRCHVSLTNTDLEHEVLVDLELRGTSVTELSARVLAAQSAGSFNSAEHPEDVSPQPLELTATATGARLTLPPHSFAIVEAA